MTTIDDTEVVIGVSDSTAQTTSGMMPAGTIKLGGQYGKWIECELTGSHAKGYEVHLKQ